MRCGCGRHSCASRSEMVSYQRGHVEGLGVRVPHASLLAGDHFLGMSPVAGCADADFAASRMKSSIICLNCGMRVVILAWLNSMLRVVSSGVLAIMETPAGDL